MDLARAVALVTEHVAEALGEAVTGADAVARVRGAVDPAAVPGDSWYLHTAYREVLAASDEALGQALTATPDSISAWLSVQVPGIDQERADQIGEELAASWDDGDFDYQTAKDVLGDHLTREEPRPRQLADPLAEHFGVTLDD